MNPLHRIAERTGVAATVALIVFGFQGGSVTAAARQASSAPATATAAAPASAPGVPFTADQLASLLPPSVYFQGRSAPLQLRNAGGTRFAGDQVVWVSLVDSSGYSSAIQQKYQFYLVTEGRLRIGDAVITAGAYGGGFLGDRFLLMDLGGHTVAEGPLKDDPALRRPRPLQVIADDPSTVRLFLGRHWVELQRVPKEDQH